MESHQLEFPNAAGLLAAGSRFENISARQRNINILKTISGALKFLKESSKVFNPVRRSIYLDRKPKTPSEDDIFVCDCIKSSKATPEQLENPTLSFDCGDKCINKLICTECEVRSCPCEELCKNRRFQLQQDLCVYPFRAGDKGWGLKAGERIPKGAFILQYIGEIFAIKSEEGYRRMARYSQSTCTYLMKLTSKELIDPTFKGNIARFINHSCEPNCLTQKWNVLGEVVVGIFAFKNIEPGEELTFDYKFDVYKTPLSLCLCGTPSCKGYLGLRPIDIQPDEKEDKFDILPCDICKGNYENDDDHLLICDKCNNGFHLECLVPKLTVIPKGSWFCPECLTKSQDTEPSSTARKTENMSALEQAEPVDDAETRMDLRSRKKTQFKETKDQVIKIFDSLYEGSEFKSMSLSPAVIEEMNRPEEETEYKVFLLSPVELAIFKDKGSKLISASTKVRVFWNNSDSSYKNSFLKQIELTIIATKRQTEFVEALLKIIEDSVRTFKESSGNVEKYFRIPAIFLKRVLGEFYYNLKNVEKDFNVKVHFNKNHITDECYPIHFLTTIILKGRSDNIVRAHLHIRNKMKELVARRKYMSRSDIKIIIGKLSTIKKEINPTEIRCCRDNALRDINHPFYTIYYKDKEVALIGTQEEVMRAERRLYDILQNNRKHSENSLSLNFLIPVCDKSQLIMIKTKSEKMFPGNKMIIYDPLHPRKNVSITLTSSYHKFNEYLEFIKKQLDSGRLYNGNFDNYQLQMLYQMSKYFFKYIQNYKQTNSMVFMKSWDTITAEFDESSLNYRSAMQILYSSLVKDFEFRFYILRVNSLFKEDSLARIRLSKAEYVDILRSTLLRKNEGFSKNFTIFSNALGANSEAIRLSGVQRFGSQEKSCDELSNNMEMEMDMDFPSEIKTLTDSAPTAWGLRNAISTTDLRPVSRFDRFNSDSIRPFGERTDKAGREKCNRSDKESDELSSEEDFQRQVKLNRKSNRFKSKYSEDSSDKQSSNSVEQKKRTDSEFRQLKSEHRSQKDKRHHRSRHEGGKSKSRRHAQNSSVSDSSSSSSSEEVKRKRHDRGNDNSSESSRNRWKRKKKHTKNSHFRKISEVSDEEVDKKQRSKFPGQFDESKTKKSRY